MKTFREYIKENYEQKAADKSKNPLALIIYDILNDKTFPDQITDGLMIRSYIRDRQPAAYTREERNGNREMIEAFEDLWILYKAAIGEYPSLA